MPRLFRVLWDFYNCNLVDVVAMLVGCRATHSVYIE